MVWAGKPEDWMELLAGCCKQLFANQHINERP